MGDERTRFRYDFVSESPRTSLLQLSLCNMNFVRASMLHGKFKIKVHCIDEWRCTTSEQRREYSICSEACTCSALSKSCEEKQRRAERRCAAAGLTATSGGIRYIYSASPRATSNSHRSLLNPLPISIRFSSLFAVSRFSFSR